MNKKGQDLSIGTLILIVLGIIVLVLLILGFSYGWSGLWEKINIFGGGGSSIADVVTNCNLAVTTNAAYTYCDEFKEVKVNGKKEYVTCEDPRVAQGIDSKLSCTGKTMEKRIQEQCQSLMISGKAKDTTKINQRNCWEVYECEGPTGLGDLIAEGAECPNGSIVKADKGIRGIPASEVCCIPSSVPAP